MGPTRTGTVLTALLVTGVLLGGAPVTVRDVLRVPAVSRTASSVQLRQQGAGGWTAEGAAGFLLAAAGGIAFALAVRARRRRS
ncbi:hypothetical protein ACWCXC_19695 [Streptomyces sp. NPDC001515]